MELNYSVIAGLAVLAMVIGAIWYGPLFGKAWLRVIGADAEDLEERKKMQKSAAPLYFIQFVLVLFQIYVLAHYVKGWNTVSGHHTSREE
jgi:Na+/H+ antiporter NhaC